MKVRLKPGVRRRAEQFGGLCYVPPRDDFFALSREAYRSVVALTDRFVPVSPEEHRAYARLAELGIAETIDPETRERAYSGVSLIGKFPELPAVAEPLVLNCFATAHCPLKCIYCHADDLMRPVQRDLEDDQQIRNVVATANQIPAMVAVITGGDPLTRPGRSHAVLAGISDDKCLVLDTSGVGDIGSLIPLLQERKVHVRVSLDSIQKQLNGRLRPANRSYTHSRDASYDGALATIQACADAGIPVTVQTVVTSRNDRQEDWVDLRDWLLGRGVRHWVIHVAVRGGKAREYEDRQDRLSRPRSLLPSEAVYSRLWAFVKDGIDHELPIDIRCTDTNNTPNSVLLVASNGDLYTEGYARKGKVKLYEAEGGRPDLIQSLMVHVDRFGHARRYLNWNPWFHDRRSIEEICVPFEVAQPSEMEEGLVETEAKLQVIDVPDVMRRLGELGFVGKKAITQRDEYYDSAERVIRQLDHVIRVRIEDGAVLFAYKGPRYYSAEGASSRLEVEVPAGRAEDVRANLKRRGLACTWFFEKRRTEFERKGSGAVIALDEIPELGFYLEIEGPLEEVRSLRESLGECLGPVERRNYREIFVEHRSSQGARAETILGAEFLRP